MMRFMHCFGTYPCFVVVYWLMGVLSFCEGKRITADCCLAPGAGNPFVGHECGDYGYGWRWSKKEYDDPAKYVIRDPRLFVLTIASIVIQIYSIPVCFNYWSKGWYTGAIVWMVSGWSSFLYHLSDALRETVLGLNPEQWVRFSNVMVLWLIGIELSLKPHFDTKVSKQFKHDTIHNYIHWGILVVALFAQETFLWKWSNKIAIVLAFVVVFSLVLSTKNQKQLMVRRIWTISMFMLAIGIIVILRGEKGQFAYNESLDKHGDSDLSRIWNSSWSLLFVPCIHIFHTNNTCENQTLAFLEKYRKLFGWFTLIGAMVIAVWIEPEPIMDPGRVKRWCCIVPPDSELSKSFNPLRIGGCGNNGWRWQATRYSLEIAWDDPKIQAFIKSTVITNLSGVPTILFFYSIRKPFQTIIGFATMMFSSLYHLADSVENTILFLTPGNWHRLDNIYAILTFISVLLFSVDSLVKEENMDIVKSVMVIVTLYLQERAPWNIECTIIPIFVCMIYVLFIWKDNYTHMVAKLNNRWMAFGILLMALASFCFSKGLDEENDYMRMYHGCWHVFAGIALYCFARASHHADPLHHEKME